MMKIKKIVFFLLIGYLFIFCHRGKTQSKHTEKANDRIITGIITTENTTNSNYTENDTTYYLLTQNETFIIQDVENIKCVDPLQCFKDHLVKVNIKLIENKNSVPNKQESIENYRKIIITDLKGIGIPDSLFVSDESSNTFVITSSQFSFNPVEPIYSSSGYYDGGEPVEKTIEKLCFQKMVILAYSLMEDETIQLTQRVKGSITISMVFRESSKTVFIKPHKNSDDFLEQLRRFLKK